MRQDPSTPHLHRLWWLPLGRVPELDATELLTALTGPSPPALLDVRSRGEWRRSRIPGAVNVPIAQLSTRLAELDLPQDRPLVAICLSAHRSIPAVRLLRARGYPQARQLEGGMLAWWRAGGPTESGPA